MDKAYSHTASSLYGGGGLSFPLLRLNPWALPWIIPLLPAFKLIKYPNGTNFNVIQNANMFPYLERYHFGLCHPHLLPGHPFSGDPLRTLEPTSETALQAMDCWGQFSIGLSSLHS